MSFLGVTEKRRIIPRWRSFSKTAMTGELSTLKDPRKSKSLRNDVSLKLYVDLWNKNKCMETAQDIIYYAVTTGCFDLAVNQANFILENKKNISDELLFISKNIVSEDQRVIDVVPDSDLKLHSLKEAVFSEIRKYKMRLRGWPRNSILWIELARLYTILNETDKAHNAVRIALQLDGQNRYVVRSAIRFFLHLSELDDAKGLFDKQESIYSDPWVLAPYVALQDKLGKTNLRIKNVRELLNEIDDAQATELAGSLASLEMDNGSIKNAKKLFKRSMLNPNDNSLAQAAWASSKLGEVTKVSDFHVPYMYEAATRDSLVNEEYEQALRHCMSWMIDEPFSSIPATTGSYVAASFFEKFDCAEQFCQMGLQANPTDKMLLNNYTVVLAKLGRLNDAMDTFRKIREVDKISPMAITILATSGLLSFRRGDIIEGRRKYLESIELAKRMGNIESGAMAAIHYAIEELECGDLPLIEIRQIVETNIKKIEHPNIKHLKDKVVNKINDKPGRLG